MGVLIAFLTRLLSPFVAGICAAAVVFVGNDPMAVFLLLVAALLAFFSLPAGGRMIMRMIAHQSR
jgi:hypothetical protein